MEASQIWSSLPAVIEEYDQAQCRATVRCLINMRYMDGSQITFPSIENVPIITPATAFAGMKLPVRAGDKVVLHIQDRDIQRLLFTTSTAGLDAPASTATDTSRLHDLTDCVAYTGFGSFNSAIPSDLDVWIFNNYEEDSYNHIRLRENGDIETRTLKATSTLGKEGRISASNTNCSLVMEDSGETELTASSSVRIVTPTLEVEGNVTVSGTIDSVGIITSELDVVSGVISGRLHTHAGDSGGSTGAPR